ncbi:hemoblobin-interacting domain-containing protein [Spartinivicinus ruber]|uniref:hemoblobin-interacting domain-containing protein n=1 Tax=Spartinivicinus ruber TaxID=2683272 RepID=UPI0013D6A375|nr:hemoblobin-interacting domain-containing protein [Spartinivicinus ruber]
MISKLKYLVTFLLLTDLPFAFSTPYEIHGYLRMSVFEYHTRYYDENGNIKVYPRQTQIDLTADNTEIQYLFSDDTPLGQDIVINFTTDSKWENAVYKVAKTDDLSNPARERELIWRLQDNSIIIDANSTPLAGYNGQHEIVVRAHGYAPRYLNIHLVQDAPRIYVSNGRKPTTGEELRLKLKDFSYRLVNPIYEVKLDDQVLNSTDYRVISNLITLEKHVVRTPGLHTIIIKAWGFKDAKRTLKFYKDHPPLSGASLTASENSAIDASSVTSAESGPFMNAAVVFNFDLISNALILQKLGLDTQAVNQIIDAWENTDKTMVRAAGQTQFYSWEDYTYEAMEAEVTGDYLSFEDFLTLPPNEYLGRPYQIKFMLNDGHFGEAIAFNQAIAIDPPAVDFNIESTTGNVVIRADAPFWLEKVQRIKVGATQLWDYEYTINNSVIRILNQDRFMSGDNLVTIIADGYRDLELTIVLD